MLASVELRSPEISGVLAGTIVDPSFVNMIENKANNPLDAAWVLEWLDGLVVELSETGESIPPWVSRAHRAAERRVEFTSQK